MFPSVKEKKKQYIVAFTYSYQNSKFLATIIDVLIKIWWLVC